MVHASPVFIRKTVASLLFLALFFLTPGMCLAIGLLQGTVTDKYTGDPLAGASITTDTGYSSSANSSGDYYLILPVGVTHVVTLSFPGYVSQSKELTLSDVVISRFDAALEVQVTVNGIYPTLGEVGKPLPITVTGAGFTESTRISMNLDSKNRMKLLGSVAVTDYPTDVVKSGNYAYAVTSISGVAQTSTFEVIDVSDPTKPLIVGAIGADTPFTGDFNGVSVDAKRSRAYVADKTIGLRIIDISNPSSPLIINTVTVAGTPWDVDLMGTFALVASYTSGFFVVDVSTDNPGTAYTTAPIIECRSVAAGNSMAYVADLLGDVTVIDLSNPLAPVQKGSVTTPGTPYDLAYADGYVYVADDFYGMQIIDVSLPLLPSLKSSVDTDDFARGVAVQGDMVYVADSNSGLVMIDVTDKNDPFISGTIATPRDPQAPVSSAAIKVAADGDRAYAADRYTGIHVMDVTAPAPLNLVGKVDIEGGATNIKVIGDRAYLTVKRFSPSWPFTVIGGSLQAYDVSDPSSPALLDSVDFSMVADDMAVSGNTAFLVGNEAGQPGRLLLINISEANPATFLDITGSLTLSAGVDAQAVDVSGTKAYIASSSSGLLVVELNPGPTYLTVVASYDDGESGDTATAIAVKNGVAYWTRYIFQLMSIVSSHLILVDVSNPYAPSPLGIESSLDLAWDVAVYGTKAYVADKGNLKVIDVSDSASPATVGTWTSPGSGVKSVSGVAANKVFVADFYNGLLMIDVTNASNPVLIGSVDSRGYPEKAAVAGELAYIVEKRFGLTIVPLPVELSSVTFGGDGLLNTTLGSPPAAGNYSVRVFNNSNSGQLIGGVSFTDTPDLLTSKAIIFAGGGDYPANLIWEETKAYANYAYDNLIYQGYKHEDITYITDQPNALARYGSQAANANLREATKDNLRDAILNWATEDPDNSDLLIFLEDHGESEAFLARGGASPEYVTAEELDSWLDTLQSSLKGKVILIYDACRSGSFLFKTTPPAGKTRLVVTSSTPEQTAYFLSETHSFSSHFWSTFTGKTGDKASMTDAFNRASDAMALYQTAQLDANGNGVPNEEDDFIALESYEGTIYALRRQFYDKDRSKPAIGIVAQDKTLAGTTATLMAKSVFDIDGDEIARVWAEIIAPDFNLDVSPATVNGAQTPSTELTDPDANGTYEALMSNYFTVRGTYIIAYYAMDVDGISSLPKTQLIKQPAGNQTLVPDQYEDDDAWQQAGVYVLNSPAPESRSFHVNGDTDWVMFYGIKDQVYNIRATDPTIISDPQIDIYKSGDTVNPVKSSNTAGPGAEEAVIGWICPADSLYYVRIKNNSGHFGANVRYKLRIYNPIALTLPGYITGRITSGGSGVAGAVVRAGSATAITLSDGSFILYVSPGGYSLSVSCSGYQPASVSASVSSGQHKSLSSVDINSIPRITNSPAGLVKANEPYSYTPSVTDVDGDPHTFSITGKPGWASFNTGNGKLWGTPNNSHVGSHGPITIKVKDTGNASDTVSFSISVLKGKGASLPSMYYLLLRTD